MSKGIKPVDPNAFLGEWPLPMETLGFIDLFQS
jgi:hypothetical protein